MAARLVRGVKGMGFACMSPPAPEEMNGVDCRKKTLASLLPPLTKGRRSYQKASGPAGPLASTRYLLEGDESFLEPLPDLHSLDSARFHSVSGDESASLKASVFSSASTSPASVRSSSSTILGVDQSVKPAAAEGNDSASEKSCPPGKPPEPRDLLTESPPAPEKDLPPGKEGVSSRASPEEQVVILKVSLHCKGCEGKVRRHLARLEGVRSFKIEFEAKRVTVVGDVTPLGVLSSVSKVKKAEFWPLT